MALRSKSTVSVNEAIRKAIYMYRDNPYSLFTNTDFSSYMYHRFHGCELEVRIKDIRIQCVHRDYPTFFRFRDKALREENLDLEGMGDPQNLDDHEAGSRGTIDMVILDPVYVRKCIEMCYDRRPESGGGSDARELIYHLINRDTRLVRRRRDRVKPFTDHDPGKEMSHALQFNLVTDPSKKAATKIVRDNRLLHMVAQSSQARCINMVFCNFPLDNATQDQLECLEAVKNAALSPLPGVLTIFIHTWLSRSLQKNNTRPLVGKNAPLWSRGFLEKMKHKTGLDVHES